MQAQAGTANLITGCMGRGKRESAITARFRITGDGPRRKRSDSGEGTRHQQLVDAGIMACIGPKPRRSAEKKASQRQVAEHFRFLSAEKGPGHASLSAMAPAESHRQRCEQWTQLTTIAANMGS